MTTLDMILIGAGVLLLARSRQHVAVEQKQIDLKDPTNWGADAWARLYGADLTLDGTHPAPSGFDAYGGANIQIGFNATPVA